MGVVAGETTGRQERLTCLTEAPEVFHSGAIEKLTCLHPVGEPRPARVLPHDPPPPAGWKPDPARNARGPRRQRSIGIIRGSCCGRCRLGVGVVNRRLVGAQFRRSRLRRRRRRRAVPTVGVVSADVRPRRRRRPRGARGCARASRRCICFSADVRSGEEGVREEGDERRGEGAVHDCAEGRAAGAELRRGKCEEAVSRETTSWPDPDKRRERCGRVRGSWRTRAAPVPCSASSPASDISRAAALVVAPGWLSDAEPTSGKGTRSGKVATKSLFGSSHSTETRRMNTRIVEDSAKSIYSRRSEQYRNAHVHLVSRAHHFK